MALLRIFAFALLVANGILLSDGVLITDGVLIGDEGSVTRSEWTAHQQR